MEDLCTGLRSCTEETGQAQRGGEVQSMDYILYSCPGGLAVKTHQYTIDGNVPGSTQYDSFPYFSPFNCSLLERHIYILHLNWMWILLSMFELLNTNH